MNCRPRSKMNNNSQLKPVEVESGNEVGSDDHEETREDERVLATRARLMMTLGEANRLTTPEIHVRARTVSSCRQRYHTQTSPCTDE